MYKNQDINKLINKHNICIKICQVVAETNTYLTRLDKAPRTIAGYNRRGWVRASALGSWRLLTDVGVTLATMFIRPSSFVNVSRNTLLSYVRPVERQRETNKNLGSGHI